MKGNILMYWIIIGLVILAFILQTARLEYKTNCQKIPYCNENYEVGELKEDVPVCIIELD